MHTASPPPTPGEPEATYLCVAAQQQPLLLQQADEVMADGWLEGEASGTVPIVIEPICCTLPHARKCSRHSGFFTSWTHHTGLGSITGPISQMGKLRLKVTRVGNEGPEHGPTWPGAHVLHDHGTFV